MRYKVYYKGDRVKTYYKDDVCIIQTNKIHHRRPFLCEENITLDFTNEQVIWEIYPKDDFSTQLLDEVEPSISGYTNYYPPKTKANSYEKSKLNHKMWSRNSQIDSAFITQDITGGKQFILEFKYLDKRLLNTSYAYNTKIGEDFITPFRLLLIKNDRIRFAGQDRYIKFDKVIKGSFSRATESSYENFVSTHSSFQSL